MQQVQLLLCLYLVLYYTVCILWCFDILIQYIQWYCTVQYSTVQYYTWYSTCLVPGKTGPGCNQVLRSYGYPGTGCFARDAGHLNFRIRWGVGARLRVMQDTGKKDTICGH